MVVGRRVYVYRNLHKDLWSIRAMDGPERGRVLGYSDEVHLTNAQFKVSEAGRQRVLRDKRKNVHAGIVGLLAETPTEITWVGVRYNPYETPTFVRRDTGVPVFNADRAFLDGSGRAHAWFI